MLKHWTDCFLYNSDVVNELCGIKCFTYWYFSVLKKMVTKQNDKYPPIKVINKALSLTKTSNVQDFSICHTVPEILKTLW